MTTYLSNRRRFLGLAAGAAGTLMLGRTRLGAAEPAKASKSKGVSSDKDAPFGGFTMAIQSYSLRNFPVEKALEHAKSLGFKGVEFFDAHFKLKSKPDDIEAMQKRLADLGLKALGHGVNPFTKDHAANRATFEFAKRAGIKNISADPTEDSFESLDKLVAEFDIRVAIHNHGPGARYDKVADVLRAIKGHDERIGACADLGHYIRSAEDPVKVIHLLKGRLFGIHLKDFAEQKAETKGVILGKGHLDALGVFKALRAVEFPEDGCLALEYEENPDNPLADIKECLAVAAEAAKKSA